MNHFGFFDFAFCAAAILLVVSGVVALWRKGSIGPVADPAMDLFETSLGAYRNRRGAKVNIDLRRASDGGYRSHATRELFQNYQAASQKRDTDDFWLSALVAGWTGSPLHGFASGGSLTGTLLGTFMHRSDNSGHGTSRHDGSQWLDMSDNQGQSPWRESGGRPGDECSGNKPFWSSWAESESDQGARDTRHSGGGVEVDIRGAAADATTSGDSSCDRSSDW